MYKWKQSDRMLLVTLILEIEFIRYRLVKYHPVPFLILSAG